MRNFYTIERPETFAGTDCRPTVVDLFCGAGGLSLGLSLGLANAGWDVRLGSDLDPACAATHRFNFCGVTETGDS